ncbi:hypothetical protein GAY28_35380, partial [Azospirillum brasilense]|nr:hypothetical protein [Azospirillum brasilense]
GGRGSVVVRRRPNGLPGCVVATGRAPRAGPAERGGPAPGSLLRGERAGVAARRAGIWVGACGGVAGDPAGAVLLSGLGVTELSVAIPAVPSVKARLRAIAMADAERTAREALDCADAAEVRALVRQRFADAGGVS